MLHFKTALLALILPGCFANPARWCCKSLDEYGKCTRLRVENEVFRESFACVKALGTDGCIQAIKGNAADVVFLHSSDIFRNRKSLLVVASQDYGIGDASYYAVAVVKKTARANLTMHSLQGARSCHTGIKKSSGWVTPMGWIARRQNERDESGKLLLFDPFSSSCAPGANNPYYIEYLPDPNKADKWCKLCIGDSSGNNRCDRDSDEGYYGYDGAFRCVAENKGEVAFVKQVTVPDDERDNYELLCADGSRAHPNAWKECHLARIPPYGLVVKRGILPSQSDIFVNGLQKAHESMDRSSFFFYETRPNLMWKSSTQLFVGPFSKTARDFLGIEYYCNMLVQEGDQIEDECVQN